MPDQLNFTEDDDANRLLATNPTALVIGMMLDQQFPMERAFLSPYLLEQRLGKPIDAPTLAAMDPEELAAVFSERPALHRFPASMGKRAHSLCAHVVEHHGGRSEAIWEEAESGKDLYDRLLALPGFGKAKARIFVGLLGKRLDVEVPGWEEVAADWPSIADVATFDDVYVLREQKRQKKKAARGG